MALSLINNCPMKLSTDLELHPIQKMSKKGSGEGGGMGKCNKKLITTPYICHPSLPTPSSKNGMFSYWGDRGNQLL